MSNYTVMFIDLVESTKLKYEFTPRDVFDVAKWLWHTVREFQWAGTKFTGDGAMMVFPEENGGSHAAVGVAKQIIQEIDAKNLAFQRVAEIEHPRDASWEGPRTGSHLRIRLRIGIATGPADAINDERDVVGTTSDLAARLCAEADTDGILVDDATKQAAMRVEPLWENLFAPCERRLMLKGVPKPKDKKTGQEVKEAFWHFKPDRLVPSPSDGPYSGGILKVFTDRDSLNRAFPAGRLLELAQPHSTILAAGRTLKFWAVRVFSRSEFLETARKKHLKFQFLVSSEGSCKYLVQEQRETIQRDRIVANSFFWNLQQNARSDYGFEFELRETNHLFLDGVVFADIELPGRPKSKPNKKVKLASGDWVDWPAHTQIAFQDINAVDSKGQKLASGTSDDPKATILMACICDGKAPRKSLCKVCGLRERTENIYNHEDIRTPLIPTSAPVETILNGHDLGLGTRNNRPSNYLRSISQYFECIRKGELNQVPPPMCVQLQVSSSCSTDCRMCDHWRDQRPELTLGQWKDVFDELGDFGVKTAIFSGGEPLMRSDLPELLSSARSAGLRLGLLTNGTMEQAEGDRRRFITAIADSVDWVSVSVDGTQATDGLIRPSRVNRLALLKEFVVGLRSAAKLPKIWATVTLQRKNANPDLFRATCEFIHNTIGISEVNFKIATGAKNTLEHEPTYLLDKSELDNLVAFLKADDLPKENGNQLAYLRACFTQEVFNVEDAVKGAPLLSFYRRKPLRCSTPFVFALIDCDGEVYTCCHLYRDNQGTDKKSQEFFRPEHRMGNASKKPFREVWNGQRYRDERLALIEIDAENPKFLPCGECTRHCQHNLVLSDLYQNYGHNLGEFKKQVAALKHDEGPVFF